MPQPHLPLTRLVDRSWHRQTLFAQRVEDFERIIVFDDKGDVEMVCDDVDGKEKHWTSESAFL